MTYPNDTRTAPGPQFRYPVDGYEWAITLYEDSALRGVRIFDPPANDPQRKVGPINDKIIPDPEGFQERGQLGPFALFVRKLPE